MGDGTAAIYDYNIKNGTATVVKNIPTENATTFDSDITKWTVGSPTGIDAKTYDDWYITVDKDGNVSTTYTATYTK